MIVLSQRSMTDVIWQKETSTFNCCLIFNTHKWFAPELCLWSALSWSKTSICICDMLPYLNKLRPAWPDQLTWNTSSTSTDHVLQCAAWLEETRIWTSFLASLASSHQLPRLGLKIDSFAPIAFSSDNLNLASSQLFIWSTCLASEWGF